MSDKKNPSDTPQEADFSDTTKLLLELKDTSELMIDLAYSALLYDNEDIAEEVFSMEEIADELEREIKLSAMEDVLEHSDSKKSYVITRLASAMERIADAASSIADVVLRDFERNPIVSLSLRDSKITITSVKVSPGSPLIGKSLGEIKLATKSGMWVIAIRRDKKYVYGPNEHTIIGEEDLLIARGPKEGTVQFKKLAFGK